MVLTIFSRLHWAAVGWVSPAGVAPRSDGHSLGRAGGADGASVSGKNKKYTASDAILALVGRRGLRKSHPITLPETICRDWLTRFTSTARIRPLLGDQDVPVVQVEQAQSPLVGEVRLLLGDALRARGELYPAAVEYETVARSYPDSPAWLDAVERCYEIAVIWSQKEPEFLLGIFPVSDWTEEVEELLIRVQERVPGSILAERAGFAALSFGSFERANIFVQKILKL